MPVRIIALVTGFLSLIWFVIRVVPKPYRATYPCMRVAAPWASGFVIYLLGITASVMSFKKFRKSFLASKYMAAGLFFFLGLAVYVIMLPFQGGTVFSSPLRVVPHEAVNQPMGTPVGIFPGRVVWGFEKKARVNAFKFL